MTQPDIKPAFQVEKLSGEIEVQTIGYDVIKREGSDKVFRRRRVSMRTIPAGYMVYIPKGDSIHVTSEDEMRRLGFLEQPALVDMESGDAVLPPSMDLKKNVDARVSRNSARRAQNV